ncbi:MAG: hypothetical protein GKR89_22250 [Candidatus Latescibacteria bacterium]|nr:hypothetical protein [Candidatus Latescibacterota bacterium]
MAARKKIAAVITEYRVPAHADVIVGKFIKGFPTDDGLQDPQVDIVSMYLDQIPDNDIGLQVSKEYDIPVYQSIPAALCLGGKELAVDGVLSIGEHGNYAYNEKGQHMYPRRFFFEQISGVMATAGRSVPVFSDKHLSYNWRDAKWMYDRARELDIPFMAGSSVPLGWRNPWLEHDLDTPIEDALMLSFGGLESYGYHGLEALQAMVERRQGGETGLVAVQCLEGDAVWQAGADGLWSRELAEAAIQVGETEEGPMEEVCKEPAAFLLEYKDGFKATLLQLGGYAKNWTYAARVNGQVQATSMLLHGAPHPHFSYLSLNIQEMFLTGQPQYPVERTLLVSGGLDALMDSRHQGHIRLETPHLDVAYRSYETMPIRPAAPKAEGASTVPFERI